MIVTQTLGFIASKLDERRTELEQFLGQGSAKDFPDYQKLCGVIHGLDFAKQILIDHVKRLETEDDE
jgi:hypothetical protein